MTMRAMLIVGWIATVLSVPEAAAAATCESLASLVLPDTTITLAQPVGAGEFTPPASRGGRGPGAAFKALPAFCRVAATLKPTSDSDIKIEVWMPAPGWNGKFQAVATGGFALGHAEKFVDFAYRSEHEMTVRAKAIVDGFYGRGPRYSYWNGCSTGGRQGLHEAQRFPGDFDGIIAGASANPRTYLNSWQLSIAQATLKDPASNIPASKYPMIHQAVVAACDGLDGVKDGLITDPTRCHFDPGVLECKGGDGPACLTAAQVTAARKVMSPLKNPHTGAEIFPGLEPGTELAWAGLVGGPEPVATALDQFKYVVFKDPSWDWRTFDLERDLAKANAVDAGTVNAINPDLKGFAGHGGKLLMYHGWSDGSVAPRASVTYYNSVVKTMGGAAKTMGWIRLFMVRGMRHGGGGEGPNSFDMIATLEQWVENGKAHDEIIATRLANGVVQRARPLCAYPQVAVYKGTGSTDEAASFVCRAQ